MKACERCHIHQATPTADQTIQEGQRQVGKRAHIKVDHCELPRPIEFRRWPDQPEPRIVDHEFRLCRIRRKSLGNAGARVRLCQIQCEYDRPRFPELFNVVSKRHQLLFSSGYQHHFVPALAEHARQFRPYARRGAG